ncbi:uncharacterized protein LOC132270140 [Cornus florida]|uniref:uncharacterized protein LOC132270140 n=1 Tax=Cornus florida TaxID=4283 RepID=UPI00289D124D|nr:uncharacterized protein LOC132270140 [Cornus florida]
MGSRLVEEEKQRLIDFLTQNADVFAWNHSDMPRISPSVSCHSLNVDPNAKPMKQKQRRFVPERNRIIAEEINRLLEAGFIREVQYPAWLSNVVVVQKKNRKWRVCIDFPNLNKACPKDSFPLPRIDLMVDATAGYERLTFLDAYSDYIRNPPVLSTPKPNEKLFVYLGVSSIATNAVLIRCKDGKQFPVFYVSKTMAEPEKRYSKAEQIILLLVNAKRKLRHYFESHLIVVLTTFPIRMILHKPDLSGRMTKWVIELSSFDITYEPRTTIKGQAVANFLLECDVEDLEEDYSCSLWKLFVDGSSNQMGAGIGIKLQTPEGTTLSQVIRLEFKATNNEAEYEALLAGLKLAKELKIKNLIAYSDSQLIVQQVTGEYGTKDKTMEAYRTVVLREVKDFDQIKFIQLPREYNEDVDHLACSASSSGETLARVIPVDVLIQSSIFYELPDLSAQQVNVIPYEPSWIDPIIAFIRDGVLPEQKDEARKIRSNAAKYAIVRDQLYRRSFSGPYLKCVTPIEARQIMQTIHEGVCGNHSGGRSLAHKTMTQGYFWPNMAQGAEEFSRRCDKCQRFGPLIH